MMDKQFWKQFWQDQKPSWRDWDWLETSAMRTMLIIAVAVVLLDTCIWRP